MNTGQELNFTTSINTQSLFAENYQTNVKRSKTTEFFEYLYSYPPKFTLKWDALDELNQDLFLEKNYGVLEHSFPFIDFVDEIFFRSSQQKAEAKSYSTQEFIDGFLNKIFSSNFYKNKTKELQTTLAPVPIFVILNGKNEIVLSKPINFSRAQVQNSPFTKTLYNSCGAFNPLVEDYSKLGFFFLSPVDAEVYLQEIAKSDMEGTQTLGLSIHCIGLNTAYSVIREHHPGIDFRLVPNYKEVQNLVNTKLTKSTLIVDDGQQQVRFRSRSVNNFPVFGKLGSWLIPARSFLQRGEYFKGVPIYLVQIRNEKQNILVDSGLNLLNVCDSAWGRFLQFYDRSIGFGHNWVMQGSLKESVKTEHQNYIFFTEDEASKFVNKQGRKVVRYSGSRISNLESLIRKPKIFVSNLEDFLEDWEETVTKEVKGTFTATNTFFIPPEDSNIEELKLLKTKKNPIIQTVSLKMRLFKRYVGFLFGTGYL